MKKLLLLIVAATLISSISFATIRRIQYWGTPVSGVDYATGTLAVAASAIGDTIMVFHSTTETFTIDKRLIIIGPGTFNWAGIVTNFNPNLQNIQPTGNGYLTITFGAGSDGTLITGCRLSFTTAAVSINNIKIRNCTDFGIGFWFVGNAGSNLVFDNWEFSKCYLQYAINGTNANGNKLTNLKMFNCIAESPFGYACFGVNATPGQSGIIENCSFTGISGNLILNSAGFLIQNCLFHNSVPTGFSNTVFNNNIFTSAPSVTGAANVFSAVANNIYIGLPTIGTNSTDGRFLLKAGSPAIGAGIGGIDCGAYGGVNPYKLSLIPAVPAFYKLTSPGTAASSNPYPITFSVRANN